MRNQIPDERGGGSGGEEKLPDTTHWEEPDSNEDWVIVDGGIMNHYRVQVWKRKDEQYWVCYSVKIPEKSAGLITAACL